MIERRLIKQLNSEIAITIQNNKSVFNHNNYNGELQVAIVRIHFQRIVSITC